MSQETVQKNVSKIGKLFGMSLAIEGALHQRVSWIKKVEV